MDAQLYQYLESGATLLTASRRLSHRLRLEFAEIAQARGLSVWRTPKIIPWASFLSDVFRSQRETISNAPRLLTELQTQALWERIVASSDGGQQLLNLKQAARSAVRSWQLLHQYLIPLDKVAAYPSDEARLFTLWARQFIAQTDNHWLDSARVAAWLLQNNYLPDTAVALRGFDLITSDMQVLLDSWRGQGVVIHVPPTAARQTISHAIALHDADEELRTAARWARHLVEKGAQRVGVVVSELARSGAHVQRVFAEVFIPAARSALHESVTPAFTVSASPALSSYALVHHALLGLQLAFRDVDTLVTGQLLRSPFLSGYETEVAARALADITARDQQRESWQLNDFADFCGIQHCPALSAALHAALSYVRENSAKALPSTWTERFNLTLQRVGWTQGRTLSSDEQQAQTKFNEVLTQLGVLDELLGIVNAQQALQQLVDICNQERFAPETNEQPVTIIDAETVAGMEFDALWVAGLHANEWPPPPDPDPFIPIELQWQYGVVSARADLCLQAARNKLQRLAGSATEVILSWPQHDDDAELRISPLLSAQPTITKDQLQISTVPTLAQQLVSQLPQLESYTDNQAPVHPGGLMRAGSRVIELQSRCAFRAQAELRLSAKPVPEMSIGIQPMERGTLVHQVLNEVWQHLREWQGLHDALKTDSDALERSVYDIAKRVAQSEMPATTMHRQRLVALEVKLTVRMIMALLQVELQRTPFRVANSEQREPFALGALRIQIQPDRLDILNDGSALLLDYKTGDSYQINDWLDRGVPGRPRSPQLPLYALAHQQQLAGISYAVMAPGVAEFRGLGNTAEIAPGIVDYGNRKPQSKIDGIDNWQQLLQHWQSVLGTLAEQFMQGVATVAPLKNECDYCHLAGLCRVHETLQEINDMDDAQGSDE